MLKLQTFNITVEDYPKGLSATELAFFLLYFRDVYHVVEQCDNRKLDPLRHADAERLFSNVKQIWEDISPEGAFRALRPNRHPRHMIEPYWMPEANIKESLRIEKISKNSPLELTLCGISTALTVAVIISGGNIEISGKKIKCTLPPLGEGIGKLREALNKKLSEF